ncbi:hypothetical protein TNCV_4711841 [Trichonephila clavipes]|nr:hypothetical protein TNCV_4711841 [Trichonephila clavipes]
MAICERERKNGWLSKAGVFLLIDQVDEKGVGTSKKFQNQLHIWFTHGRVREEYLVPFEEYNDPSGHSAHPWALKLTRGRERLSHEATLHYGLFDN